MLRPRMLPAIAAVISLIAVSALPQQNSREMFERASMLDESNQNLSEAIRLYNQVITQAKNQRALAAKAQYRIGVLCQRLGHKAEAQRAFKTVVSQYADQTGVAQQAQARLITTGTNGKKTDGVVKPTGPSPDGWYFETFTLSTIGNLLPAIDPARHRLYVVTSRYSERGSDAAVKRAERQGLHSMYEPSTLIVIDTDANSIVKAVPLSVYIDHIAFNSANNKLYATAQVNGHVKVIDTNTFAYTNTAVPGHPTGIAANSATNKIYVTSQGFEGNDKLFVIDGASNALAGPYDLDGVAGEVVVNPATNRIYGLAPPKTRVFNGADNSILADLAGIGVVEADPVHNVIYATAAGADHYDIQALDGNTHSLIASFGFASPARAIAIDSSIDRLYVALPGKDQIAVIDTATHTEMGRLLLSGAPNHIAVDPRTGHAYVCHSSNPAMIGVLAGRSLEGELPEEFSDGFDSATLDPSWTVVPGKGSYSLTTNPGRLRIRATESSAPNPPLLLARRFRGDYWTLEVKASYFTGASGGSRNLFFGVTFGSVPTAGSREKPAIRTPINVVYIYRSRDDWNGCCAGETREYFWESGRQVSTNVLPSNAADAYVWQIKRNGRTITVERSDDGINFALISAHTFGSQVDGVIQCFTTGVDSYSNNNAYADYDYVRLTRMPTDQSSAADDQSGKSARPARP